MSASTSTRPTPEAILAEPAGYVMDGWVAEHLMSWALADYSSDVGTAWRVVELLIARKVGCDLWRTGPEREWGCVFADDVEGGHYGRACAGEVSLAICRAALIAVLVRDNKEVSGVRS